MEVRLAEIVCSALRLETARVPSKQETAYQTRMRNGPNDWIFQCLFFFNQGEFEDNGFFSITLMNIKLHAECLILKDILCR